LQSLNSINIRDKRVTEISYKNVSIEISECFEFNESLIEKGSIKFHEFNLEIEFGTICSEEDKSFANNCLSIKESSGGCHKFSIFKNTLILSLFCFIYQVSLSSSQLIEPILQNDSHIDSFENKVKYKSFEKFESLEGNNVKILIFRKLIFIFFIGFYYYIHGKLKEFLIWCFGSLAL
jgi:hypothetical protein